MIWLHIFIFVISWLLMISSSKWLTDSLMRIAKFLGWKEFVVAFLTMAFGSSLPNLFVGILSAIKGIPQLSLGDVIGANIFDLTVVVALAAFISRQGISAPSRTVQGSSIFTIGSAILPLLLISDGKLSRTDAILLFSTFFFYISWLFKGEDRFKKAYDGMPAVKGWTYFLKEIGIFIISIVLLILGARGIVSAVSYFAQILNLPLIFMGILFLGISDCLPETFFSVNAAKESQDWMILGNLMGSVMITATLVLGVVTLIHPIEIFDFTPIAVGRFFLIIAAIFFLIFLRSGKKITRKEAIFLLSIYLLFLLTQIIILI